MALLSVPVNPDSVTVSQQAQTRTMNLKQLNRIQPFYYLHLCFSFRVVSKWKTW